MIKEMILASLEQIWHIIPIILAIILFKMFVNHKDKKRILRQNEEHEKNGLTLEVRTTNKYEELGYATKKVTSNDLGIDLIFEKDNRVLLVQCNTSLDKRSIVGSDITTFYDNAKSYVSLNGMQGLNMELRYAISYMDVLDKSAVKIFSDDSYGCKYIVV